MTPAGVVTQAADVGDGRADALERGTKLRQQALARVGRRDRPCRAREKAQPEALLERPDRMADRRPAHAELDGRLGEAALVRHDREGREEAELVPEDW